MVKNYNTRLITPFVRVIEGEELFNFERVSKTPNMVFFYVCMAFSIGMTPNTQNRAYIPFYTLFLYRSRNQYTYQKRKRSQCLWLENDKIRIITPFVRFFDGI